MPATCHFVGCEAIVRDGEAFCGEHFRKLPEGMRNRLCIGSTKCRRKPDDHRNRRKYAYAVSDAVEVLMAQAASPEGAAGS